MKNALSVVLWILGVWRLKWVASHGQDTNDALGIVAKTIGGISLLASMMMLGICYNALWRYHQTLKKKQ